MSGLAELLGGRRPPGAYRWNSKMRLTDIRDIVEHVGWRFAHFEGARIETSAEFHQAVAEALALPGHYGRNLDALADCLRDIEPRQLVLWDSWSVLADADPRLFAIAVELMGSAVALVLRGEGPEVDVPLLD